MHLALPLPLPLLVFLSAGLLAVVLRRLFLAPAAPMTPPSSSPDSQRKPSPSFSLWLAPAADAPATPTFAALNRSLPGPHFPAHATLLGSAPDGAALDDVVRSIKAALADWRKAAVAGQRQEGEGLEVELEDVRTGVEYFRCILVKLHDDPALHALHDNILAHLPSPTERPTYFPHVSLVYSDMPPADRQAAVDGLYADGRARAVAGGKAVELRAHGADKDGARTAKFDRVVVVVTKDVLPEDWVPVAEVRI